MIITGNNDKPLPDLIGIIGQARSGKDSIANLLPEYTRMSLADPIKEGLMAAFRWSESMLYGDDKDSICPVFEISPRKAMQVLGNSFRKELRDDIWISILTQRILNYPGSVVVPDIRHINEAQAIIDWGGELWHVERPGLDGAAVGIGNHPSEVEQKEIDPALFTYNISTDDYSFLISKTTEYIKGRS